SKVLLLVHVSLKGQTKRVGFRQRMIDPSVEIDAVGRPPQVGVDGSIRSGGVDAGRVVKRGTASRQRKRRPLLQQRATEIESVLLRLFRSFFVDEGVARVHGVIAEREIKAAAQRPKAGLRRDVD